MGIDNPADYQAKNPVFTEKGMTFTVDLDDIEYEFFIPINGKHNVYNALFAIAITHILGFAPEDMIKGLATYHKPRRRLRMYHLKNNVKLIDDTFNANPNSVKAALDVLTNVSEQRNVAVLADMAELGRYTGKAHIEVGKHAAAKPNLELLFTYGKHAKKIARAAVNEGFPPDRVIHSSKRSLLHKRLVNTIGPGSTILVKGSHNMKMDKTVAFLKKGTFKGKEREFICKPERAPIPPAHCPLTLPPEDLGNERPLLFPT